MKLVFWGGLVCLAVGRGRVGAEPAEIPSAEAVRDLLAKEPITQATWPVWRARLTSWLGDRTQRTDAAFKAARQFAQKQAGPDGELSPWIAADPFAWYMLGGACMHASSEDPASQQQQLSAAEHAFRRSLQLDSHFARAHRNLALSLIYQSLTAPRKEGAANAPPARDEEIRRELETAARLEPSLPLAFERGLHSFGQKDFPASERHFREALKDQPDEVHIAQYAARSVSAQDAPPGGGKWTETIDSIAQKFPEDGELRTHRALALARDGRFAEAQSEIREARKRNVDPAQLFGPQFESEVNRLARPQNLWRWAGWTAAGFAIVYVGAMVLMAIFGLVLAGYTRGAKAARLLGRPAEEWVHFGQVARSGGESTLAKLYMAGLMSGLILFYLAVPFLVAGMLAATGGLLYFIFMLPRIPLKLIVIVVVIGLGTAWAMIKSLFATMGRGSFGIVKTADQCPRLHETVRAVAQRVDTAPVDEIYLAPGSAIGVHQEGRGPFGMFGVKRRVLTLGMSTMRYLTVSELKAILAHEYGHFSHKDTFYSRFIYQVAVSIEEALRGMGQAGGKLNYVNPVFWALYGYYKAYTLLASGFSRSREFLADRMAVSLYGKEAFTSGLTKVAADGTLFEATIYHNTNQLLAENKAFVNMYEAFDKFRSDDEGSQERENVCRKLHEERGSLFASHPTFRERVEAIMPFPDVPPQETGPALELFEQPEEIEKELTDFFTGYVAQIRAMQAAAARSG